MRSVWLWGAAAVLACTAVPAQDGPERFTRPADVLAYAQGLQKGKIYDYAEKAYRHFLTRFPSHEHRSLAQLHLIECLRLQGKDREMIAEIREFCRVRPKDANAERLRYREGEACFRLKAYEEASSCFEVLRDASNEVIREQSRYFLAQCRFRKAPDNPDGFALYRELSALPLRKDRPVRELAVYYLAREERRLRHHAEAIRLYGILSAYPDARASLREEAFYEMGELYLTTGAFEQAVSSYGRCLTLYPRGRCAGEARKRRAEAVFQLGRYDEALRMVLEWRGLNPGADDPDIDYLHGRCLYRRGEYATARPHFEAVVSHPRSTQEMRRLSLVNGIHCLFEEPREESWKQGLQWCAQYREGFRDVHFETAVEEFEARLLQKLGRYEDALRGYSRTIRALPGNEQARRNRLRLMTAVCLSELKRFAEAAAVYRELSDEPSLAEQRVPYRRQAAVLELKEDASGIRAENDLKVLLDVPGLPAEDAAVFHEWLFGIYMKRKDAVQAQRHIAVLLTMRQGDVREEYLYQNALLLAQLKRPDEALACLSEALSKETFADVSREVGMRVLCLSLLQERCQAGDAAAQERFSEQARVLLSFPPERTNAQMTGAKWYHVSRIVRLRHERLPGAGERGLLEGLYRRVLSEGYREAPAFFAAQHYAELAVSGDAPRYSAASEVLKGMTVALSDVLAAPAAHEPLCRELGQAENLHRSALALLARCEFELGRDASASAACERVLRYGEGFIASKRCLFLQARIYFEREPRSLENALKKLMSYQYVLSEPLPPEEEAEAMVLMVKVLSELKRADAAQEAYRQLRVRYPERAAREVWPPSVVPPAP